jgi:hypothetical protein
VDRGPGLLEPFLNQIWTLFKGWGRRTQGLAPWIDGLLDWLAEAAFGKCLIYFLSGLTTQESLLIFKFLQTQQTSDYIIPHAY